MKKRGILRGREREGERDMENEGGWHQGFFIHEKTKLIESKRANNIKGIKGIQEKRLNTQR